MSDPREILITSALPYANGPIHIGHLVEYIQTDIWARFQRMRGHRCWYVCADDAHGTPIMLKARQEGISPEALIARVSEEHQADFAAFRVAFDNYHSTHSDENRHYASLIYERNRDAGHIARRTITQAYDPVEQMFLPDRFIKGECPKCGAPDQYGDNCEACGASYSPNELKNPRSAVSGAVPEQRESDHYFFKLADFDEMLKAWTGGGSLQNSADWIGGGLEHGRRSAGNDSDRSPQRFLILRLWCQGGQAGVFPECRKICFLFKQDCEQHRPIGPGKRLSGGLGHLEPIAHSSEKGKLAGWRQVGARDRPERVLLPERTI